MRRERVLVEEEMAGVRALVVVRRHVDDLADAEAKEDAELHPRHRAPMAVLGSFRGAHLTRFQRAQQRIDDFVGVVRHRARARYGAQIFYPAREQIVARRDSGHIDTPTAASALRTAPACFSSIGTSGRRRTFSIFLIIASAAFTGSGLASRNAARIHGSRRKCR